MTEKQNDPQDRIPHQSEDALIDDLLLQAEKKKNGKAEDAEKKPALPLPTEMLIAPKAKEKGMLFGLVVARLGDSPFEWYGYALASDRDPQRIIREVILAPNQNVAYGGLLVKGENVALANAEVKRINRARGTDFSIVGWTHNHSDFEVHHSPTDVANFYKVLNSVSLNTEFSVQEKLPLLEGFVRHDTLEEKLVLKGSKITDGSLIYSFPEEAEILAVLKRYGINPQGEEARKVSRALLSDLLKAAKVEVTRSRIVGFCYSMVVNNLGDEPYTEIGVIEEETLTGKKKQYTQKIPLRVVDVAEDIAFTERDLEEEARKKIIFPQKNVSKKLAAVLAEAVAGLTAAGVDKIIVKVNDPREGDKAKPKVKKAALEEKPSSTVSERSFHKVRYSTNPELADKNPDVKLVGLEDLSKLFVRTALDYLDRWNGYVLYDSFLVAVLNSLLISRQGFTRAFAEAVPELFSEYRVSNSARVAGEIVAKKGSTFGDGIIFSLALGIAPDLKVLPQRDLAVGFMESFVNALGATGIDQVVEQYFPLFLGIDKRIINFSNQALDYLKKGESHRYSSWLSGVFQILLKKKDLTLDEAVMTRGDLYLNSRENDAPFLAAGEKSGIKHCLLLGSYSPDALELMAQFSVADQRNTALEQYARKVLVRIQNQEQKTVDNLLGSYPGKDSSRDLGDGIGNDDGSGKTNTKTKNDLGSKDSGSKDSLLNLLEKEK